MTQPSVSSLARRVFAAFQARDRAAIEALFADDFTFTSPYDDRIDRAAYFERCWPNFGNIRAFTLEMVLEDGDQGVVRYSAETAAGKAFRNVELFRRQGDKIVEVDVYFGRTLKDAPSA